MLHVVMHFSLSLILFTASSYSAFYIASELCGGQVHAQAFNCFCMRREKEQQRTKSINVCKQNDHFQWNSI